MKFRIIERTGSNFTKYYIVQKKVLFWWHQLWISYHFEFCGDAFITFDRIFKTVEEAERAIAEYTHEHVKDKCIKEIESET